MNFRQTAVSSRHLSATRPPAPIATAQATPLAAALLAMLLFSAALVGATAVKAQTPAEKGLAIAVEADNRDLGWIDSESQVKMILTNRNNETSTRELRIKSLEIQDPNLGDKSLTIFDHPRDIEGTAFLSHTRILEPDDQWLYLPALKRVKRISSANKSGPFVGSEFAYEDLVSQEVAKYSYSWLRDEACGTLQCFVVEQIPVYENSGYTKEIVWIDQQEYRAMKIEFYDRKDSLLKTLTNSDYRQYLDRYWRAHTLQMDNHQTGKSTTLTFETYQFKVGNKEGDFTPNRLKRAR
jgi:hypothetical protein